MALHTASQHNSHWVSVGIWLILLTFSNHFIHLRPFAAASAVVSNQVVSDFASCRNIPGDAGWPTESEWAALNATVGGRLIATIPIAHACHDPTYVNATCDVLKAQWPLPALSVPQPAEILTPYFQNQSCDPYTAESKPCTLGNYVSYSINVTSDVDVITGVLFAQTHNVRLVIKNTGHDFYGKSTGKGGLALWTHNLNSMEIISNYSKPYYQGPAIKVGAGVSGGDATLYTSRYGYRVVTGGCPTVGIAGGFVQGGGESLLSGLYGLGADNVLEWEVVTAEGGHLIATPSQHADLYWALCGGGGGTYAVAISMTTRLFQDGPVGRAGFLISAATTGSLDAFWGAVDIFHSHLQSVVDSEGISVIYALSNTSLDVFTVTAPNKTAADVSQILAPMTSALGAYGLSLTALNFATGSANSYEGHYQATLGPIMAVASSNSVTAGRMISRNNLANNVSGIGQTLRSITANGDFSVLCTAFNANGVVGQVSANSVQPAWRNAVSSCTVSGVWDWSIPFADMLKRQNELTSFVTPAFEAATPGSATYLNEGDLQQPNWQDVFYGTNYKRLRDIKKRYDIADLFYGLTAVGSEAWEADSQGRLCRTGA